MSIIATSNMFWLLKVVGVISCCVLQCLGCGMEEWRFSSASPHTFNCPLWHTKGSGCWQAPARYKKAHKEWEGSEGDSGPEPLCFDYGSHLPCSHHQHVRKHREDADRLGELKWVKVNTSWVLQFSVEWLETV